MSRWCHWLNNCWLFCLSIKKYIQNSFFSFTCYTFSEIQVLLIQYSIFTQSWSNKLYFPINKSFVSISVKHKEVRTENSAKVLFSSTVSAIKGYSCNLNSCTLGRKYILLIKNIKYWLWLISVVSTWFYYIKRHWGMITMKMPLEKQHVNIAVFDSWGYLLEDI